MDRFYMEWCFCFWLLDSQVQSATCGSNLNFETSSLSDFGLR